MSRANTAETLPPTARSIALLLASTPTVQDAHPGVLHQLLEFSHRYTTQVLSDALVYSDHAGRTGKIEIDDVALAVQARVGWEFGGRVPKEYMLSLATQTNSVPLPSVPEVFGVRLPPPSECLTNVNFELVPNKPPPGVKLYDEEIDEVEESESEDDDEDMEPATVIPPSRNDVHVQDQQMQDVHVPPPAPVGALQTPSDVDMMTPVLAGGEVSDAEEEDGLFGGGDEEEEESGDEPMEEVTTAVVDVPATTNGVKRKLVEEDDYD